MPESSWLFIRDRESIWIERPYGFSIIVAGPGSARAHLVFPHEEALQAFQVAAAERLTRAGWFLWGFDEQRRKRGDSDRTQSVVCTPAQPRESAMRYRHGSRSKHRITDIQRSTR